MGTDLIHATATEQFGRWTILRESGPAAELFDLDRSMAFSTPTVRVLTVSAPTIVLGSSQSLEIVDQASSVARGIDVVRRRSGGGAVWLDDDLLWVDVFVPADDRLWESDIGKSMWWLGDAWAHALAAVGVSGTAVHKGPMVTNDWSSLVCFAGLGPGEVTIGGKKAVGISQRRNRAGALLQSGVVRRWAPSAFLSHLDLDPDRHERTGVRPDDAGVGVGAAADDALSYLVAHLP